MRQIGKESGEEWGEGGKGRKQKWRRERTRGREERERRKKEHKEGREEEGEEGKGGEERPSSAQSHPHQNSLLPLKWFRFEVDFNVQTGCPESLIRDRTLGQYCPSGKCLQVP